MTATATDIVDIFNFHSCTAPYIPTHEHMYIDAKAW